MDQQKFDFPQQPALPRYPAGRRELRFGGALLIGCLFLWNTILYGGFNLGFAIGAVAVICCSSGYFVSSGYRFDRYSGALVCFSLLIAAGFGWASDYLKLIMLLILLVSVNLSFCLVTGQNRRDPGALASLLDAPRACFTVGLAGMAPAMRGLNDARKNAGTAGKKGGAVALGLLLAVPVTAVMTVLLMRADAAFEGLMDLLPETDWSEPVWTLLFGGFADWILYARTVGLRYKEKAPVGAARFRGVSSITVNILLGCVSSVYAVYLLSQLAYLGGGFSGILPEEYTLAQYARRGFFEMAWLSGINLGILCFAMGMVGNAESHRRLGRGLCLFLGAVSLFLIATASAKMLLYIGSYGLTRLRVLTEIFMIWLAVTTVLVCIRLFKTRFPYMKAVVIAALALSTLTFWADLDTQIARYNVHAYRSGKLETIDTAHLRSLGNGAVPYVAQLLEDEDPDVALRAESILRNSTAQVKDFRDWNRVEAKAEAILTQWEARQCPVDLAGLGITSEGASVLFHQDTHDGFHGDGQTTAVLQLTPEREADLAELSQTDPLWHTLPLTDTVSLALYGSDVRAPFYADESGYPLMPEVKHGYWYFCDRHPAAADPAADTQFLSRASYNFTLAVYDGDTHVLYYFEVDT